MLNHRFIPVFAVLLAGAPRLAAQDPIFLFSNATDEVVAPADLKGSPNIDVRPNTAREINLFVRNAAEDPHDLRVHLLDAKGKVLATADVKKAASRSYTRVRFAKPAPPAGNSAPPATPPAAAAPPGVELAPTPGFASDRVGFGLRLVDEEAKINRTQSMVVIVLKPESYVRPVGPMKYKNGGGESLLELTVKAEPPFLAGPPCLVEMVFPPQPNLDVAAMGAGVYRKTITRSGDTVKLYARGLPLRAGNDKGNEIVYLNVDGVPRVYTFRPNLHLERRNLTDVVEPVDPAVRLIEDGKKEPPIAFISLPKDRYPLRVEVDNSTSPFKLELTQLSGEVVTAVTVPGARHERVWLDPAGEGGAVRVEARVADWVVPLDTRDLRGQFILTATLTDARTNVQGEGRRVAFSRTLILDDTPPPVDRIMIARIPERQMRGRPMKVTVFASDPESPIAKVAVGLGTSGPPDASSPAFVTPPSVPGAAWTAELTVPADKKLGEDEVSVTATNAVGLTSTRTFKIRWVAPRPAPEARNQRRDGPATIPAPQEELGSKKEPDPGVKVPVPLPLNADDKRPVAPPTDAKKGGKEDITVVVTNAVGITAAKVIEIQLLDPPTVGTIVGAVTAGEPRRGRASTNLVLKDADGKEKSTTRTNPKGEYEFLNVPPGSYTVSAAKPGSGAGTAAAQVAAGETVTANVVLVRRP